MRIPSLHLADLADAAYQPLSKRINSVSGEEEYDDIVLDDASYIPLEFANNPATGFQGMIVQRKDSSQFIVVFRGTEPTEIADVITDAQMVARRINMQAADANRLVERARWHAQEWESESADLLPSEITLTGHSLGGGLGQLMSAQHGLRGETFNAYGAASLLAVRGGNHDVINHVLATDVVSAASPHVGQVRVYALPEEVAFLDSSLGGYGAQASGSGNPLHTAVLQGLGTHGIHFFSRLPRSDNQPHPYTVLQDESTRTRAQQNAQQIETFRRQIASIREHVTEGAQLGGALGAGLGYRAGAVARVQGVGADLAADAIRATEPLRTQSLHLAGETTGALAGGIARGMAEMAAQARERLGERHARLQRARMHFRLGGDEGIAAVLRVLAEGVPDKPASQLREVAQQMERDARQRAQDEQAQAQRRQENAQLQADFMRQFGIEAAHDAQNGVRQVAQHVREQASTLSRDAAEGFDVVAAFFNAHADQLQHSGRVAGEITGGLGALGAGNMARTHQHHAETMTAPLHDAMRDRAPFQHAPAPAHWQEPMHPQRPRHAPMPEDQPQPPLTYLDAEHPRHALYQCIRQRMPDTVCDEKVADLTREACRQGLIHADRVKSADFFHDHVCLVGDRGQVAVLDLHAPAVPLAETMRRAEQHDQWVEQVEARVAERQQLAALGQQGPVLMR